MELVPVERIGGISEGGSVHFDPVMHPLMVEAIEQLKIIARAESIDLDFKKSTADERGWQKVFGHNDAL